MQQLFFLLALLCAVSLQAQNDGFRPLFNGKNLDGWTTYGGTAPFGVEGDRIISRSLDEKPNTFLCTDARYGDFVLELEFFNEAPMNSGVMVRGQWRQQDDGLRRVFGYQVEIDPSARAYTGGIYDEARRGWIYPLHRNPAARSAFKTGEWNKLRVEFIGNELRTYVNGQPVANLVDATDASGMICLQTHGSWTDDQVGKEMHWRKVMIKENATAADRWNKMTAPQISLLTNELTDWEKRHGWRLLWDGKSTAGWRGAKLDGFPATGWEVADGELRVLASNGGESTNGGDIITTDHFSDFELSFEFKPSEGANSGVKYFVDPTLNKGRGSAIGLEFQILDDNKHPDAKRGVAGNRTAGSLYDLITAKVLDTPRNKEVRVDDWNRGRIVVRGGHVEHWLNGYKVVEYDRFSQMFAALVAYSKYKDWENFGRWPAGPILLQDHGDDVAFRSLKIREL